MSNLAEKQLRTLADGLALYDCTTPRQAKNGTREYLDFNGSKNNDVVSYVVTSQGHVRRKFTRGNRVDSYPLNPRGCFGLTAVSPLEQVGILAIAVLNYRNR